MFDWLKNLFGGGSKSPAPSSRPASSSSPAKSVNSFGGSRVSGSGGGSSSQTMNRPAAQDDSLALARQREEDERKKRQEAERLKREADAKKAEADARAAQQAEFSKKLAFNPKVQLQKAQPVVNDTRTPQQKQIDDLYQQNLPQAKQNQQRGMGVFDKVADFLAGGAANKRAETEARTKAVTQYQEKNGWNNDKTAIDYSGKTLQKANTTATDTRNAIKNTNTAVDVIRYVPGAGIGELGANAIRGNFSGDKEADDRVLREQNNLTQAQIDKLSPDDRNKYLTVAKAGLAAGVLDLVGVGAGSLAKGAGRTVLKKATAKELVKDIASKEGVKTLAKNTVIGAGAGAGVGYGGTKIMGGSDEEARQNAVSGAIAGSFGGVAQSPFDSAVKLTKANKGNAKAITRSLVDGQVVDNIDGINKFKLNKVNTAEIVADDAAKIPNSVNDNEPPENKIEVAPGVSTSQSNPSFTSRRDTPRVAPIDNTPAYVRKQQADENAMRNAADEEVANAQDPLMRPSYEHKADIERVVREEQNNLDTFLNASPDLSDLQIKNAIDEAQARVIARTDELKARRFDTPSEQTAVNIPDPTSIRALAKADELPTSDVPMAAFSNAVDGSARLEKAAPAPADAVPVVQPTPTDIASAAAEGDLRIPTRGDDMTPAYIRRNQVDAQGNPMMQSDVEVQRQLAEQGVVPDRGNSVVATQEDQMAEAARREVDGTNAPNVRSRVADRITDDDLRSDLMANAPKKESVNLADAEMSAKAALNDMSDEDLINRFAGDIRVSDPTGFYTALNGIRRLERVNTPEADLAIRNALDAMTDYAAESGRGLRTTQILFDDMPAAMKTDYLINKLSKAGADLTDTERSQLAHLIQMSDDSTSNLRGLEDQARQMLEDGSITNANLSPETQAKIVGLRKEIESATREKELTAGEAYRYYQEQLNRSPEGGLPFGKKAGDIGRTLMLSSPSGRIFDIFSTAATAIDDLINKNVSNLIGKGVNLIKGNGSVADTLASPKQLVKGMKEGLIRTKQAFQGKDHVEDFLGEAKRATRGDINSGGGVVRQTIRAAVELPTNMTRGLRNDELYRQGMQEAAQLGLEGDARQAYAEVRSLVPTHSQLDKAVDTQMRANMLHENGASRMLNGLALSLDNNKVLGGWLAPVLRNQVAPFTSWLGGNLNRTFTDKNVLYNAGHAVLSAKRGDTQGVIDDVAKLAVNSAQTYAVGALLTQAGVITTTDANGDDYGGLYFHVGDRYVPVAVAGTASVPLILGNAFEQASQAAQKDGSGAEAFVSALATNMLKNAGVSSLLGGENNLQATVKKVIDGEPLDAGAGFVGDFVRQYIPSITGDVNAFLDQTGLNPTGESANTKVTGINPETGREKTNIPATEINKTLARIPFTAQDLPRKEGTAAKDFIDRIFKGNRETSGQQQNREQTASKEDIKKSLEKEGVPLTADDIKAFADSGDYDKAIKGSQYRLSQMEGDNKVPESRKQALRDDITRYGLERDGVPTNDEGVKARVEAGDFDKAIKGYEYKLSKFENDKNKPESKKQEIRDEITRLAVTRDNNFGSDAIKLYNETSQTEWRAMGNPKSDDYDPDRYSLLLAYDDLLTKSGVSKSAKGGEKNKYIAAKSGGGSGSRGGSRSRGGSGGGSGGSDIIPVNLDAATNSISFSPDKLQKLDASFATPQSAIPVLQKVQNYDSSKLKKIKVSKGVL